MFKFIIHRILISFPTVIGVSILAFALIRMVPGDPVLLLIGERGASPEAYEQMQKNLGLDKPLLDQYFTYIGGALKGDLGKSIVSKRSVFKEFADRFPATLELGFLAMLWSTFFGILLGVIAAFRRKTFWDFFVICGSLLGYSMPIFWWGLVLILFFSIGLGWTPVAGRVSAFIEIEPVTGFMLIDSWFVKGGAWSAFLSSLHHLILPSFVLGTIPMAAIARMTRSSLLEVLKEDYVRTAKAKGLDFYGIVFKHAFRNALIPVVTVIGLMFGTILTGAILTETIFAWPGIGRWMVTSVTSRDYPVIQGGILLIAMIIILVNMLVDLSYLLIDPKLRSQKG